MMMGSSRIINRICVHSTTTTITLTTYYYNQMYVQMTNCGSPICMIDGSAQWVDADGWMHKWLDGSGIVVLLRDDWTTTTTSHNDIVVCHYHANNGQTVCECMRVSVCKEWMGWDAVTFVGALRQIVVVWQEPATIIHNTRIQLLQLLFLFL